MAENYVQVVPASTGKKIEAETRSQDGSEVMRQVVTLGDGREVDMAETLLQILAEMRETRLVLCVATNQKYNELDDNLIPP